MAFSVKANQAFSLLELLIAMTMMSIIATSLYASLSIGFKAKEHSESALDTKRSARIVMDLLKQEIISAVPPKGILAGRFEGANGHDDSGNESDSVVFYSAAYNPEDDEIAGDMIKVQISLATGKDSNERVLIRGITKNLLSPKSLAPHEEVLCAGVRSMNLRYFDGYEWLDEWNSSDQDNSLPKAVEISIEFEHADKMKNGEKDGYGLTCAFSLPCA